MQVRCERITGPAGEDQGESTSSLVIGSTYVVLAVHAGSTTRTSFQILDERDEPIFVSAIDFQVVDPRVPPGWAVTMGHAGSIVLCQPPMADSGFWDAYSDGEFAAIASYEQALFDILEFDRATREPSPVGLRHRPAEVRPPLLSLDLDPAFIADHVRLTPAELAVGLGYGWLTAAEVVEVVERGLLIGDDDLTEVEWEIAHLPRWNEPAIKELLDGIDVSPRDRLDCTRPWFIVALEKLRENGADSLRQTDFVERFFVTVGYPRWMNEFVPAMGDR